MSFGSEDPMKERLAESIKTADIGTVKEIVANNPESVHWKTSYGIPMTHIAAGKGHTHILEYLLDNGADIEQKAPDKSTIMMAAALSDFGHVVEALAKRGADIEAMDDIGRTPFIRAVVEINRNTAKRLVTLGAQVPINVNHLNLLTRSKYDSSYFSGKLDEVIKDAIKARDSGRYPTAQQLCAEFRKMKEAEKSAAIEKTHQDGLNSGVRVPGKLTLTPKKQI